MPQIYAVVGITGNVGSKVAKLLLESGHKVRGVVRNAESDPAKAFATQGAELVNANLSDAAALTAAFTGVDGAFIMTPPENLSDNPEKALETYSAALVQAVIDSKVPKVVILSSIAAHLPSGTGLIQKLYALEQSFKSIPNVSVAFLRAGYFAENTALAIIPALQFGVVKFLVDPLVKLPVILTQDIALHAVKLFQEDFKGLKIVEIEGPVHMNYSEIADVIGEVLGKPLERELLPKEARPAFLEPFGFGKVGAERFYELAVAAENGLIKWEGGHELVQGSSTYKDFVIGFVQYLASQQKQ